MLGMRPMIWLLAGRLAMAGQNETAQGQSPKPPDPWATMRGCLVVLERVAACAGDKSFQTYLQRWTAMAGRPGTAKRHEVLRRLKSWGKALGRRQQCAVWARKSGAEEHIGEGSSLARSVLDHRSTCETFAKRLDEDGWLPKALVDSDDD